MLRGVTVVLTVTVLWASAGFRGLVSAERDSRASLELVDGGYVNLLIGIDERVPNNPVLLDRIKSVFTEGSEFLFQATEGRAYFKHIHILVPESWEDSEDFASVQWQRYDQSDVIIDFNRNNGTDQTGNNRPYTKQAKSCGEPGQYIHLTPDYVKSLNTAKSFGPYGKTLTHEWAHYRWGVFDEYPLEGGSHFYADSHGNIEAVRCVLGITGSRVRPMPDSDEPCQVDEGGFPEDKCRFRDDLEITGYTGSLMYKQFLPAITTFCEKAANGVPEGNTHNREAPNLQNNECQGKSIWEVMRQHRDFFSGKGENGANDFGGEEEEFDGEPVPEFTVVKKRSTRIVLVVDTSGSMKGQRLRQLKQAAETLITGIVLDGEKLGLVEFAEESDILSHLRTINDTNRVALLSNIGSLTAEGWTSIGAGILKGLEVLQGPSENIEDAAGGKMIVITDGDENRDPRITDVLPLVNGSSVTIDTVAIGMDASADLELLSATTGGSAYLLEEESNSLSDVFSKSSAAEKSKMSMPITLKSDFIRIPADQTFTDAFYIDSSIGSNTRLVVGHSHEGGVSVSLTDPSGGVITAGSPEYDANSDFLRIRIAIPGDAQVGLWTFEIRNNHYAVENVTVLIQSHARGNQEPILIQSEWRYDTIVPPQKQSLYVTVGRGYTPVVGAAVKAFVDLPCGNGNETVTLHPKDDGIGADLRRDDGIYSSFFTSFCGEGRYGVNIEVFNDGQLTSVAFGSIIGTGAAINPEFAERGEDSEPELRSTGDFRRVSIGGSFKCEGFNNCSGSVDIYPPARITDLVATNVDHYSRQIKLNFTAPGDDLSLGKASYYVIVISRNVSDIYDNFDRVPEVTSDSIVEGNLTVTQEAGQTEAFAIRVNETGAFSYAFAVVAVDDEGNQGEPSNVVTSSALDRNLPTPTFVLPLGLVIGCGLGGAVLLILVIAALCVCRNIRQTDRKKTDLKNLEVGMTNGSMVNDVRYANKDEMETSNKAAQPPRNNPMGTPQGPPSGPPMPPCYPQKPTIDPLKPPNSPLKAPMSPLKPPISPLKPHSSPLWQANTPLEPPIVPLKPPIVPLKPPSAQLRDPPSAPPRPVSFSERPPSVVLQSPSALLPMENQDNPLYEDIISRRHKDPNWDPSLPNNSEGGGANIKTGHVANTKAAFDNIGFLK